MITRLSCILSLILAGFCGTAALAQNPPTTTWVANPTNGVQLFTVTFRPTNAQAGTRYPAIVFVPGSLGTTTTFSDANMQAQADLGFVTVKFDPDGRGQSTNGGSQRCHCQQPACAVAFVRKSRTPTALAWDLVQNSG